MRRIILFLLSAAAALSTTSIPAVVALVTPASSSKPFTEILPLKAAMLTKNWQGLLLDVDQKVGIVPELGKSSVGVQRFGPELERRTLCKRQFERLYEASFALALADKNPTAPLQRAKRLVIPQLLIDEIPRGPRCKAFACLTMPATIALVEVVEEPPQQEKEDVDDNGCCNCKWSVLMLIVNPTERSIDAIVAAERTMLQELCTLMNSNATANGGSASTGMLRVLDKAKDTLAGDDEALGLTLIPAGDSDDDDDNGNAVAEDGNDNDDDAATTWYRCEL